MKNRLLEDIGDSQSSVPVRPVRRVQAAPPPAPQPQSSAAPPHAPTPPGVPEASARQRAGVWRNRSPLDPPVVAPSTAQGPQPSVAPPPAPEPLRAEPRMSPEIASFSSREPDWSVPLQPEPPPWTERWGRKALGWTVGLAAAVAVAATAAWMVNETRVESTLAVVADHTPPQANPPAPAVLAAAPVSKAETETPPPLKLLPPEPVVAAAAEAGPVAAEDDASGAVAAETGTEGQGATGLADAAPAAAGTAVAAAATSKAVTPPKAKEPAAKRAPERRVAAAAPEKRKRPEAKKPAPKPARERVLARAPATPATPVRTVPAQQPDPESPLAETLRMCRAAGYHATACLKRGCEATRFGLVCRG